MTIPATDFTLRYLRNDRLEARTPSHHLGDSADLCASNVVEFEDPDVTIAAVHASARHRAKEDFSKPSDADLVIASHIRTMAHRIIAVVLFLTVTTVGVESIASTVRSVEIVVFLGQLAPVAGLHVTESRRPHRHY